MSTRDPGPPTWKEALDGHQLERAKAADLVRRLKDSIGRLAAGDAAERAAATGLLVKAEAEWTHWNAYHARAVAFIRVHPSMANASILADCEHDDMQQPACYVGPDDGWYRLPEAKAVPVASFYEREPGDDSDEEAT